MYACKIFITHVHIYVYTYIYRVMFKYPISHFPNTNHMQDEKLISMNEGNLWQSSTESNRTERSKTQQRAFISEMLNEHYYYGLGVMGNDFPLKMTAVDIYVCIFLYKYMSEYGCVKSKKNYIWKNNNAPNIYHTQRAS